VEVAALVVPAALAALVVPAALAELVVPVVLAVWAVPAGEIASPLCRVGVATNGNTILNIVAELPTKIAQQRTDSAARRAATLLPTVRLAPANRWDGKAATYPAAPPQGTAQATAPAGMVWAIVAGAPVLATGPVEAEPIASEAAISRAAVAETATPSEEDREDTADRALAAAAAAVPQAWDLEGVEAAFAEAAVAGGADRLPTVIGNPRSTK